MTIPARAGRRVADAVFVDLRALIVSGAFAPGQRIDPDEIGERLDVSRTPIREALVRLEADGLVDRVPYRGTVVAGVDVSLAEETAAVRVHLEGLVVRLAMTALTEDTLDRMQAALDELTGLEATANYDPEEWNRHNDGFHGALYAIAGCPSLTGPLETLNAQASRIRTHFDVRRGPAADDHSEILAACRSGDADAAARAVQRHIVRAVLLLMSPETAAPSSPLTLAARLAGIEDTLTAEPTAL